VTEESISTSTDPAIRNVSSPDDPTGLADLGSVIETALQRGIGDQAVTGPGCPARLAEAMRYALLAPGKRLRPGLVLMAGEACGVDPLSPAAETLYPAVAAVEMVHAYSLIHDDLPAMDDDDLRRGRPTVHLQFDEATAILTGDALLAAAFRCLCRGSASGDQVARAVDCLSRAAGATRLVGGQADDLAAENESSSIREAVAGDPDQALVVLESIHRRKTGALIQASLSLGAIFSQNAAAGPTQANQRAEVALSDYAEDLGLAFQVVDDLLDFTSDASRLGKRTGKDAERGKLTYPGLLGVEASRRRAAELVESATAHAELLGPGAWRLIKMARYVLERTH